jgi:hypothetical protein
MVIYTKTGAKAAKHEWIPKVHDVGAISYVSIQVYAPVGGRNFSSIACHDLDCATFLHLPAAHVLFSLASYSINKHPLPLSGSAAWIIHICPASADIFKAWQDMRDEVTSATRALQAALKRNVAAERAGDDVE